MRVLFVQRQPCIRALKTAAGLRSARGPSLRLAFAYQGLTLDAAYGAGDELFDEWMPLGDDPAAGLRAAIERFRPDLVHSHNLPDSLTVAAHEVARGRLPVVHDVHDLQSLRATPYEDGFPEPRDPLELERRAIEGSDALITVSDELMDVIAARHAPPPVRAVFGNFALRRDLPPDIPPPERPAAEPPRAVYQGTLALNGGHYDLREVFAGVVRGGLHLDVFPVREGAAYRELAAGLPGLTVHEPLAPGALLRVLPGYDLGWAGFNDALNRAHLDTALPNKAYEYIGCGLPVLTLRHRALSAMVEREGVGLVLDDPAGAAERVAGTDLVALRRRVAAARARMTVEANIGAVTAVYRELGAG